MKESLLGMVVVTSVLIGQSADAGTLQEVRTHGSLRCGVSSGLAGFATIDVNGVWQGFEVAYCRAIAAAVLGDPNQVDFVALNGWDRFSELASGRIDVLVSSSAWTFTRDVDFNLTFLGVSYHDTHGFMVRLEGGITSVSELDSLRVCFETGTIAERALAEHFHLSGLVLEPQPVETLAEGQQQYLAGACDAYAKNVSGLAAMRASFASPEEHVILSETHAKKPLGPVVRHGDDQWADIVRWVHFGLIAAEELGINSANIGELIQGSTNPEVNRILGVEGDFGSMLGMDNEWAIRAISAGGNYGEIFAATIGDGTPIGLARGLNALWTQGGLLYAPPFR